MEENLIAAAVFEFLENGGDLPDEASANPQNRFKFQTAISKHSYAKSCEAKGLAHDAMEKAEKVESTVDTFQIVILEKFKTLKGAVDVRLGVVAGIVTVAQVALYFLLR